MSIDKGRIGVFFLMIGLVLLVIFFTTDQAQHPAYGFFFIGAALTFLGGYLIWRNRKPPAPTERFRTLRKMRQKQAERREKKKQH
ncbi:MAG: hypothetical protein JW726_16470 [Anaerolineales bacterium]|nr:hypothetical protein [Anaerolineales bacterium]